MASSASFRLLSDAPASSIDQRDDHLKFLPYADALAFLIDQKVDPPTPLIAAISAPWGAGKSTLADLVEGQLREKSEWDEQHIICRFNAWQHDDAPHLGAAFAADIAQHVNRHRPWWRRLIQPLPLSVLTPEQRARRKYSVVLVSIIVAISLVLESESRKLLLAAMQPTDAHWKAAEHDVHGVGISGLVLLSVLTFIYPKIFSGTKAVARFINDPQAEAARGSMASVRKQLGQFVRTATHAERRLIIFVDDLERCRPPRAVEVCEVASQLLDYPDIVTVLVADMDVIAMSAAIKYRGLELPGADQPNDETTSAAYAQYGNDYLQKLIQIQFDLPPVGRQQLMELLVGLQRPAAEHEHISLVSRIRNALRSSESAPPAIAAAIGVMAILNPELAPILVLGATSIIGAIGKAVSGSNRKRAQKTRDSVDDSIRSAMKGDEENTMKRTFETVAAEKQTSDPGFIRRRIFGAFVEKLAKDGVIRDIDRLVYGYLPDRPRAAKRLLNQVRLTMVIALHRGLLEPSNTVGQRRNASRVAKWVILQERWPSVAAAAYDDVDEVARLEALAQASHADDLGVELKRYSISDSENVSDLRKLLSSSPDFGDLKELITLGGPPSQPLVGE